MAIINRETDYAIRILRSLSKGDKVSVGEMCEKELLPESFTYKISKKLAKSGIVNITRGPEGGCTLNRSLDEITLFELMESIDDSQILINCMEKGYDCEFRSKNGCRVHCNMAVLQEEINSVLRSYTIADLLQ